MAFDFPNSPTNGQVFTPSGGPTYTYDLPGTKWTVTPALASVTITSGIYSPTFTHIANIDASTVHPWLYLRVADRVVVAGYFEADATTGSGTGAEIQATLPIASDLASSVQAVGALNCIGSTAVGTQILSDAATNKVRLLWAASGTINLGFSFIFMYTVI